MQEHQLVDEAGNPPLHSIAMERQASMPPVLLDSRCEAHIEDALDRIFARLVAVLPYEERRQRRAEMRAEIDADVAAHIELAAPSDVAVELALASLEKRNALAGQTLRQTQAVRTPRKPESSMRHDTLTAVVLFGLPYIFITTGRSDAAFMDAFSTHARFFAAEILGVPLVAGVLTGLTARYKPILGVLNGLAVWALLGIVLPSFISGLSAMNVEAVSDSFTNAHPTYGSVLQFMVRELCYGVYGVGFWILMGCLGAAIGAATKKGLNRRFGRRLRMQSANLAVRLKGLRARRAR